MVEADDGSAFVTHLSFNGSLVFQHSSFMEIAVSQKSQSLIDVATSTLIRFLAPSDVIVVHLVPRQNH